MKHYKLIEEKYLKTDKCNALVFEHNDTKAKVLVINNKDDNKVFGIGFRTPPKNSNGVCHIIEHCVLNGSKKYKTKEPFMDMVKGSLQTFLNAITYADKTIYPVASRNDKDFKNLTDLYLDAVFNPTVRHEEKIFRQEGWRYNLEDDKLTYKGVVYNEMRGATSSLESQVFSNIYEKLMPDTIYAYNSGGDPYVIPSLTYKEFCDYYDEFYHPSNSYIYLYGDLDYNEYLEYIHDEYLSNYEYREVNSKIQKQPRFNDTLYEVKYINTDKEVKENESYLTYSTLYREYEEINTQLLAHILSSALISNDSSSLKQKLLQSGLVEDVLSSSSSSDSLEYSFSLTAKNVNVENRDKIVNIIEEELKNIVENGIDEELFMSELNNLKFYLKEKPISVKGVAFFSMAFSTWLYDKSPIDALDLDDDLEYIENNLKNGLFEKFIKENILESDHKSIVSHIPKKGLNQQKDEIMAEKLEEKRKSLTDEETNKFIQARIDMENFQNRENTEEEKLTIPKLEKSDVTTTLTPVNREVIKKEDYTLLKHNLPTSGIDYLDLVFDINHVVDPEEILYLSLLSQLLIMLDTENYNYSDLYKTVLLNTGEISAKINQILDKNTKRYNKVLILTTKLFTENLEKGCELLSEIINNVKFDNLDRIKELILMIKSRIEMELLYNGSHFMLNRAGSNHLAHLKYAQYIDGVDYYLFIKKLANSENIEEISNKLKEIYNKLFSKKNLVVNIASTFKNENVENNIDKLVSEIEYKDFETKTFEFTPSTNREAFTTSANVNYVSYANNIKEEFEPQYVVLNNLVSQNYLYPEIRAKGGAYGSGMFIGENQLFATYSYRDPNLTRTIDVYNKIPEFLENLDISEEDLLPNIIGSVGKFDPPQTERMKSFTDLLLYLKNEDYKDIEEKIKKALDVDLEYLKNLAPKMKELLENPSLAVLSNPLEVEKHKELFDKIIEL